MKPWFPRLQQRFEKNAEYTPKRPVRFALIFFGVIMILMEIGTVLTFYTDARDHLDDLDGAILITFGIALWLTLMATGWMLTPLKVRKRIHYGLMLVKWACVIIGLLSYGLLITLGVKALGCVVTMAKVGLVVIPGILIVWTLFSVWGWVRYARGQTVN